MNYIYFFIVNILLISSINYIQYKFNFLLDIKLKHKIKIKEKIPLSGGIYILVSIITCKLFYDIDISTNLLIVLFLFLV